MFNIDIASLRDPATLARIKQHISTAAALVSAYEGGTEDAQSSTRFGSSRDALVRAMACAGKAPDRDQQRQLSEAYNLGWDTVRLHGGVKS